MKNPPEKQIVTENTHEAIVDKTTWETAQQLRANRRRFTKTGYKSIFAGVVFCADCGAKLTCRSSKIKSGVTYTFICSSYRNPKGNSRTRNSTLPRSTAERQMKKQRQDFSLPLFYIRARR
ncbi:MAG: recombinase zinc beta ribbon domain-containing protein [Ruminococcus sp.]|nr:recombinase zinc beta ribbon domain-containing protein [Ruminococcus sp.]MBR4622836.1 recombinase zinc beta ribbon domain-containing protein [Ruminococcus sp.]